MGVKESRSPRVSESRSLRVPESQCPKFWVPESRCFFQWYIKELTSLIRNLQLHTIISYHFLSYAGYFALEKPLFFYKKSMYCTSRLSSEGARSTNSQDSHILSSLILIKIIKFEFNFCWKTNFKRCLVFRKAETMFIKHQTNWI